MNHPKHFLAVCLTLAMVSTRADVLVDDMSGVANKTYAGGFVFDIASEGTQWSWPDPALSWSYFDPQDFGLAEQGQFARVEGTLGGAEDYPYIGFGCYLTMGKDTVDLSQSVGAFAFRARGVGNWRFKFRNKLIDSLAVKAGKTGDQVAWMMPVAVTEQWQWFVLPVDQFSANVGAVNTLYTRDFAAADAMTSVYKIYWQTDGYTSADAGTQVRIDIDDFYLLGSISEIGLSSKAPTTEHCAAMDAVVPGACGWSSARLPLHRVRGMGGSPEGQRVYSIDGKLVGSGGRSDVVTSRRVYLIGTPGRAARGITNGR